MYFGNRYWNFILVGYQIILQIDMYFKSKVINLTIEVFTLKMLPQLIPIFIPFEMKLLAIVIALDNTMKCFGFEDS
jgi:hypothetical protein